MGSAFNTTEKKVEEKKKMFPVAVIGDIAVGITCLCNRIVHDKFEETGVSVLSEFFGILKEMDMNIPVWSVKGNERYLSFDQCYFSRPKGIIIVYDITDIGSLKTVLRILNCPELYRSDAVFLLLGNKKDLTTHRAVSYELARSIAEMHRALFSEVSAKTGEGVKEAWTKFLRMMKNQELGVDLFSGINVEEKDSEMQFPPHLCDMAVEELLEASTSEKFTFLENMDIDASLKFTCHSTSLENILFYDMILKRPKCEKNLKLLRRICSGDPKYLRNTRHSGGNTGSQNALPICLKFFNGSLVPIYHTFNVIFVGGKAVGTTSILRRILKNAYKEEYKITYIHSFERTMDLGKIKCIIEFCDTGADPVLQGVVASYTKNADVVFTVYDVTNEESFQCAKSWILYVRERNLKNASIFFIGTKIDLQKPKQVSKEYAEKIAKTYKAFFYECSSKTGEGMTEIKDAFFRILKSKTERN